MSTNPYAAPKAVVADDTVVSKGDFVPGGQALPAARGTAWIGEAWQLFKRQPGMWIGMVLVLFVVFVGLGLIPFVGSLATMLLGPVFAAGLVIGCRALDEGGELELSHLFAGFHERAGTLVGVGALYLAASLVVMFVVGLGMGVGMFTLMGGNPAAAAEMGMTILLAALVMTALLLPAVMAVWFAAPLVVFHQLGAVDAMKQSFIGCVRNIVPFLLYGLVLFLLTILATLPLMLGWLVLGPVLAASLYTAYKDIYLKPRA